MIKLVGILNITPDSFSDGGMYDSPETAVAHARQLFESGADIVDIGAESTRPDATVLTWLEEVGRLQGVVAIAKEENWKISIDSYHPETISWAAEELDDFIINDVTGFFSSDMREVAAKTGNEVILSHFPKSAFGDIQAAHTQQQMGSVAEVKAELEERIAQLVEAGVAKEKIIIDPGIGFGKTTGLNVQLLEFAKEFPDYRVMIGYSRKRFLGSHRMELEANLKAARTAIEAGATYLRVHDVAGHKTVTS